MLFHLLVPSWFAWTAHGRHYGQLFCFSKKSLAVADCVVTLCNFFTLQFLSPV